MTTSSLITTNDLCILFDITWVRNVLESDNISEVSSNNTRNSFKRKGGIWNRLYWCQGIVSWSLLETSSLCQNVWVLRLLKWATYRHRVRFKILGFIKLVPPLQRLADRRLFWLTNIILWKFSEWKMWTDFKCLGQLNVDWSENLQGLMERIKQEIKSKFR